MKLQHLFWAFTIVLATALVSAGCGGSGTNADTPVQPTVTSTFPASGATSVPTNFANPGTSVITASFSQPMVPATINTRTFYAIANNSGGQLPGVVTYANQTATLTLDSALPPNTQITASITVDSANSARGHAAVGQPYVWSFTSASNNSAAAVKAL